MTKGKPTQIDNSKSSSIHFYTLGDNVMSLLLKNCHRIKADLTFADFRIVKFCDFAQPSGND